MICQRVRRTIPVVKGAVGIPLGRPHMINIRPRPACLSDKEVKGPVNRVLQPRNAVPQSVVITPSVPSIPLRLGKPGPKFGTPVEG